MGEGFQKAPGAEVKSKSFEEDQIAVSLLTVYHSTSKVHSRRSFSLPSKVLVRLLLLTY